MASSGTMSYAGAAALEVGQLVKTCAAELFPQRPLWSPVKIAVPLLTMPRGVPRQFVVLLVMVTSAGSLPVVGNVFHNLSIPFDVSVAATLVPFDQIPQGQASAPRLIAKLAD